MKLRKVIIFLLLFVAACGGGKAPKDRLVIAIESNPTTFDPRLAVSAYSIKISQLIFNGLMKMDDNFNLVPDLAESFTQVNDTTYKFKLRKGVKFHSGDLLTAKDVVYTYNSIIDGTIPSPHKMAFDKVKDIRIEGEDVVIITLKEPHAPFITALRKGIVPMSLSEKLGKDFGLNPVGTGPYKFSEFKSDSHVLLQANKDYFGEKAKTPFLEFKILKDDNVRILQLIKGNIDLVQNAVPPALLESLKNHKNIVIETAPSTVFAYLGMNLEDPILSKKEVRQALAYAINREDIIKHKWEGYAVPADTLLSKNHWAFSDNVHVYKYNPYKAKVLLDRAGFPAEDSGGGKGVRFKLSFKTSTQKQRIDIANLIAKQLADVDIKVSVTPFEWGTFFRDIKTGNFQLYTLSWVGVTEPDIYYNIYHSSQVPPDGPNRNKYINKEIDNLTVKGRTTLDNKKRAAVYAEIQKIVSEDLPYIPLWYEDNIVVRQKYVNNYKIRADAGFQDVVNVTKGKN